MVIDKFNVFCNVSCRGFHYAGHTNATFLSLFNVPEATAIIRGLNRQEPYWLHNLRLAFVPESEHFELALWVRSAWPVPSTKSPNL